MFKKFVILFLFLIAGTSSVFAYEQYMPSKYEYLNVGKYFNKSKHEVKFYNDYNKDNLVRYYCLIPDESDTGYLLEKSPHGAVGYKWINDGYMNVEKVWK